MCLEAVSSSSKVMAVLWCTANPSQASSTLASLRNQAVCGDYILTRAPGAPCKATEGYRERLPWERILAPALLDCVDLIALNLYFTVREMGAVMATL